MANVTLAKVDVYDDCRMPRHFEQIFDHRLCVIVLRWSEFIVNVAESDHRRVDIGQAILLHLPEKPLIIDRTIG